MRHQYIVGVDEAGRGPLAGPVAVGVVVIPLHYPMHLLRGVKDSKQLSPLQRERLFKHITQLPGIRWSVAMTGSKTIDSIGIQRAVYRALSRSLRCVNVNAQRSSILLDGGLRAPTKFKNQKTIVKGDQKEVVIGAASILAKVVRDNYMNNLHKKEPRYGFNLHKGYGTRYHMLTIAQFGLSKYHRRSYCRSSFES